MKRAPIATIERGGTKLKRTLGAIGLGLFLTGTATVHGEAPYVFSVTTAYETSGNCTSINIGNPHTTAIGLEQISSDPIVRYHQPYLYVLNRSLSDNIQVIDPGQGFATISEVSTGPGSNPQDIVVIDSARAYVSRYESAWLYEMNPMTGAILDSIDLGSFADSDGLPEMARMVRDGDHIFIQLQLLDRNNFWSPTFPGYVVVVDITTNTVVDADPGTAGTQPIALSAGNPNGQMVLDRDNRKLYVSVLGNYGVQDGGVEKIDIDLLATDGWVTTETQLGGDVGPIALFGNKVYAIMSDDFFFTNQLVTASTATGAKLSTILTTSGYVSDMELDDASAQIFFCDRSITSPGVRVVSTLTDLETTSSPIATGLPPFDLALVRPVDVGVAESDEAESFPAGSRAWAQPNPFQASTEIFFRNPTAVPRQVKIYDTAGRLVRKLSGTTSVLWDGHSTGGDDAAPGVYFYRVSSGEMRENGRIVLVR